MLIGLIAANDEAQRFYPLKNAKIRDEGIWSEC